MRSLFPDRRTAHALAERGVAMIEFAIASGVMVVMVLGILSYGEVLANYIQLKYAVGELSRQIAVGEDATERAERFTAAQTEVITNSGFSANCVTFTPTGYTGTVTVTGLYLLDQEGCRTMPSLFLPMPGTLEAKNTFTVQ